MGFDKILVPLDGSKLGEVAVPSAVLLANPGGWIHFISVMDPNCFNEIVVRNVNKMTISQMDQKVASLEPHDAAIEVYARKKYLLAFVDKLAAQGFEATSQVMVGYPSSAIANIACEGFDIIVISTHGRTGFRKFLIGSVAESVLHNSPCPVCIVPAYSLHLQSRFGLQA